MKLQKPLETKLEQTNNIQRLPEIEGLDLAESQEFIESLCQETRTRTMLALFIFMVLKKGKTLYYNPFNSFRDKMLNFFKGTPHSALFDKNPYDEFYRYHRISALHLRFPEEFSALLQGRWRENMYTSKPPIDIGALPIKVQISTRIKTFNAVKDLDTVDDTKSWNKLLSRETKRCTNKKHRKALDNASLSKPPTWSIEEYLEFVKDGLLPFLEMAAAYYKTLASDKVFEEWNQISEQVQAFQSSRANISQQLQSLAENELSILIKKLEEFYKFINNLYNKIDELRQKTYLAIAQEKSSNSRTLEQQTDLGSLDTAVERMTQSQLLIYEIEELARKLYETCKSLGERLEKPLTI